MILINDNWETIIDLQDISNIIRKHYNYDLADELDKLIPEHTDEEYYDLERKLMDTQDEISSLEDELYYKENEIENLNETIFELEDRISELENI